MLPHFNGIECTSSTIPQDLTLIRKISILLEDIKHLQKILNLKSNSLYIELIIPVPLYNESLLKQCIGIQRIILKGTSENMDRIFADFIAYKRFPFVIGGPLDKHNVDIYRNKNKVQTDNPDLKKFLHNEIFNDEIFKVSSCKKDNSQTDENTFTRF
ncbi:hypothetical protein HQ489_05740 [Candidatus Woesearchaeota archaeon]|nr:hypothetical protein [Candidatus Woesearchaeota archaeon]